MCPRSFRYLSGHVLVTCHTANRLSLEPLGSSRIRLAINIHLLSDFGAIALPRYLRYASQIAMRVTPRLRKLSLVKMRGADLNLALNQGYKLYSL
jgi:hypothetical protein